jgi:predicted HD superfamily hydrolase involved in NAD metabolism
MNSTNEIIAKLRQTLSKERLEHCIGTSEYALFLANRYTPKFLESHKEDIMNAALFHDMCREWKESSLVEFISLHSIEVEEEEINYPVLLHAPVAAYKMNESELLNKEYMKRAVRWHTLGSKEMGILGALLYCSDYMEPKRPYLREEKREKLLHSTSLEELTLWVINTHMEHMKESNRKVATSTHTLLGYLKEGGIFR